MARIRPSAMGSSAPLAALRRSSMAPWNSWKASGSWNCSWIISSSSAASLPARSWGGTGTWNIRQNDSLMRETPRWGLSTRMALGHVLDQGPQPGGEGVEGGLAALAFGDVVHGARDAGHHARFAQGDAGVHLHPPHLVVPGAEPELTPHRVLGRLLGVGEHVQVAPLVHRVHAVQEGGAQASATGNPVMASQAGFRNDQLPSRSIWNTVSRRWSTRDLYRAWSAGGEAGSPAGRRRAPTAARKASQAGPWGTGVPEAARAARC